MRWWARPRGWFPASSLPCWRCDTCGDGLLRTRGSSVRSGWLQWDSMAFHPGLGSFVTCADLRWEFGREHSVQTVGVNRALEKPGSKVYRRWHDALLAFRSGRPPEHGAIWLTRYPTLMVEWYPHVLVVSTLIPQGPRKTLNLIEFFYPEEIAAFEREFVEANQAAYMETCVEDDEIAMRMDAGRLALYERGDDEVGPYQSPMEDGMQHFHEWYGQAMAGLPSRF